MYCFLYFLLLQSVINFFLSSAFSTIKKVDTPDINRRLLNPRKLQIDNSEKFREVILTMSCNAKHCNAMECNELLKLCVLYPIRVHFGKCIVLHYTCRNKKSTQVSVHELPFPLHKLQLREEQGAGGEVEAQVVRGRSREQGVRGRSREQEVRWRSREEELRCSS